MKGKGNSINYKYRMHDPRIGRFFAIDPLASKYPHNSPYAFSENRVIDGVELEGLEYLDTDDKNIDCQQENDDGTYSLTLGEHEFINVTKETIDGKDYFQLVEGENKTKVDMYYGENGWSRDSREGKLMTSDLGGTTTNTYYPSFVSNHWPEMFGREMTKQEKETLRRGCIGLTSCVLGEHEFLPPIMDPYFVFDTYEQAMEMYNSVQTIYDNNPEEGLRAVLFSMMFYSESETAFRPNLSGNVDMSGYKWVTSKGPGFTNYDFGFYNESSGRWWHVDRGGAQMKLKESTLYKFSTFGVDFNRRIFVVSFTTLPLPKK